MTNLTLKITGMSCAACSGGIERALNALPEVTAAVNLTTERATISYDEAAYSPEDFIAKIEKLGFGAAIPAAKSEDNDDKAKQKTIRIMRAKFIACAVFAFPLLYIAMVPMISLVKLPFYGELLDMMTNYPMYYALAQLVLVIPCMGIGYKFYTVGFKAIFRLRPNMDSLIAVGTLAAFLYSLYSTYQIYHMNFHAVHALYFESAGVIITLILLGKTLTEVSKGKTSKAIKTLMNLAPKTATLLVDGIESEVAIEDVNAGDILLIKPGSSVPVDAIVVSGGSAVDESMLTGESLPIDKAKGDRVFAATINTNGILTVKAEKVGADTALAQIIKLVEDAQGSKAPIAALADKVSGMFVPIVCGIALLSGIAWLVATKDITFALTIFISVLVIACPCALGLATPTAIMVGTGKAAEKGILFKSGAALETAHKINVVVFDKTGTITTGHPVLVHHDVDLKTVASLERYSNHPVAKAVVDAYDGEYYEVDNFKEIVGQGVRGTIDGALIEISRGQVYKDGVPIGSFTVEDTEKPTSKEAIGKLHDMGIKTVMITGDSKAAAEEIAARVGIDEIYAEVLPADKANIIKSLKAEGQSIGMVGDGINDAVALTTADVGIAIGSGTDVAMESADIVLMHSELTDVAAAITLSRRTIRNIKQNLFWAFGYNVIGIPVAAGILHLFGGPLLSPMIAAAAMSLSSVSVLLNALRLGRGKK